MKHSARQHNLSHCIQVTMVITYNPTYLMRKESNGWYKMMELLKDECVTALGN
jgi:hypothetical protein